MSSSQLLKSWTINQELINWLEEIIALSDPATIHLVDGSKQEYDLLIKELIRSKTAIPLNKTLRPNSYLARSNPEDVARVEDRTFICSLKEEDAGPTNNWVDPAEMKKKLTSLFYGCMKGRTLYVVPYCMGPLNSPYARIGVEITDSAYVVCNMFIMTHIGRSALDVLGNGSFVKCLHSVGQPLEPNVEDVPWPCNCQNIYIAHFPETKEVWSFGSGYGGNALLNKKCFALRIASKMAYEDGWMAEHMLIISVTNPEGIKRYFAASFPSACGKTNLAMLTSTLSGWKVECVGDDIAWMHWDKDGRLRAINPEFGFFGVAPGTSWQTNPNAMEAIKKNTLFTNVALTDEGDVWWEGMSDKPPEHLISWLGVDWTPGIHTRATPTPAAQPNARFTTPVSQCPILDSDWQAPEGVPISGIIFGGRRTNTIPLVRQAINWKQGVFFGASMSSETTAASTGEIGKLRHDPFAMLPFCGYNMGDYFAHWLSMEKEGRKMPAIFYVNWFNKDQKGNFLWPGFGENIRVLKWMFEQIEGANAAIQTPIGYIPKPTSLDLSGLTLSKSAIDALLEIDKSKWQKEVGELEHYFQIFGNKLPQALRQALELLKEQVR